MRSVLSVLLLVLLPATAFGQARPLVLVRAGEASLCPSGSWGPRPDRSGTISSTIRRRRRRSSPCTWLHAVPRRLAEQLLRLEAGSVLRPRGPDHSHYYELFVKLSGFVARKLPGGVSLEQYQAFSDRIGAQVLMVPNLETASVEDQAEWFRTVHRGGRSHAHRVGQRVLGGHEPGPGRTGRWPDEPTAMRVTQRYLNAFRAYLPKGSKSPCRPSALVPRRTFQPRPDDPAAAPVERRPSAGALVRRGDDPPLSASERGAGTGRRKTRSRRGSPGGTCGP